MAGAAAPLKSVRIWQLKPDTDVYMKFISYEDTVRQFGEPSPEHYRVAYDGQLDTNDLEAIYTRCNVNHPPGYDGHSLSMSGDRLTDALYTEMAEFGFLTKYIFGTGIEEIDINSWRDIEVQYSDGRTVKLEERFESPQHAVNVIRRMLHISGMIQLWKQL